MNAGKGSHPAPRGRQGARGGHRASQGICGDAPKLQEIRGFATAEPQLRGEEAKAKPRGKRLPRGFLFIFAKMTTLPRGCFFLSSLLQAEILVQ